MPSSPTASQTPAAEPEFRMPPMEGYTGTPEEVERRWYEEAYLPRGAKMRQLSFRALFLGCFLGGIMAIPNIFMGLKSGVTMGLSLTCTLMGFMLWNTLLKLRLVKGRLTVLEYNAMASAASSASFTTVGGLVSAVAAFMLINHRTVPLHWLFLWTLGIALLGVTLAIPLKRRIINIEQLPFPGSIAGAETLQLLCASGGKGERTGMALVWGGIFSAFYGLWDGLSELSEACGRWGYQRTVEWMDKLYGWSPAQASAYGSRQLFGDHLAARGVGLNFDLLFMVSGCFMGLRTTVVMFLAACACWLGWVPMLEGWNLLLKLPPGGHPGYAYLLSYTVWFGASCLVVAGIMQVVFMIWDAYSSARRKRREGGGSKAGQSAEMAAIETPMSWFVLGQSLTAAMLVWVAHSAFGIVWWETLLAIALTFLLSIVACRVMGQTSMSASSSLAKVTQLTFGTLNPVQEGMAPAVRSSLLNANLMTAAITTSASSNAADLLSDLKVGYFLGAHPRKQFLAQFIGVFAGAFASVLTFFALVPSHRTIEGGPAPAVMAEGKPVFLSQRDEGRVTKGADGQMSLLVDAGSLAVLGESRFQLNQVVPVVTANQEPKFLGPSAWIWKGVAEVVAEGIGRMPQGKKLGLVWGLVTGFVLTLLGRVLPSKAARWVPSAGVVGLGFIFQWWMSLMMMLGALLVALWRKKSQPTHDEFMVPVASGLFVGAPLVTAALKFVNNGQGIVQALGEAFQTMFR